METILQVVFKDGAHSDLPQYVLGPNDGHLVPLVGDSVVFEDGAWLVKERYFNFGESPVKVTLMVARANS